MPRGIRWLAVDEERLRLLWRDPTVGKAKIAAVFGVTILAINQKALKLRLGRRPRLVLIGGKPVPPRVVEEMQAALRREIEAAKAEMATTPLYRPAWP